MLGTLDRKLGRDLWAVRGQVLAIACVLAGGIATYVMSVSTLRSLERTQSRMYGEFRFPEVFAGLKQAPRSVATRLAATPGVEAVEARVVAPASITLAGYRQPIAGQVVGLPRGGGRFNRVHLHAGRIPEPGREREVLVSDGFVQAHRLQPGFGLEVTINGRRQQVVVVGVASSPEFTYQLAPGSIVPDFKSYCILWMHAEPLEAATDMTGAFNQVALSLGRGARVEDAAQAVDAVLKPYGGQGAYGRKDQISHRFLSEEFRQLRMMATLFPAIFLGVAGFLLHVVVGRLMATQRGQIATLKAFGYTTGALVGHFLKFTAGVVLAGTGLGVASGAWLGAGLARMYRDVYRFPYLDFGVDWEVGAMALAGSLAAGGLGTLWPVLRAAGESPAVAMQPATPGRYGRSWLELPWFSQPTRMIARNLVRRPVKSVLSMAGVAMSTAILIVGGFMSDGVDYMVFAQLRRAQLDDLTVTFFNPVAERGLYSLRSLPGVQAAEPVRTVAARFRFAQRSYRTVVQGLEPEGRLRRLLDTELRPVELPAEGIVLTDYLATMLGVRPGDRLTVELLEGSRAVREVAVAGVVREYIGVTGYMRREALNRLLREGDVATGAYLAVDEPALPGLYERLRGVPAVAGVAARAQAVRSFYETLAAQMLTMALFNTLLAATIAIGVVYNTVRIALSERGRELASLRVLGYTRGEVSYILLGELTLVVFVAIPVGLGMGYGLVWFLMHSLQTELFRIPLVIRPSTYALAALVILVATAGSALLVGRKINHLDLVEVLKARE
ncbi:MAG: ABC transporter permease [Acidobacteriota bacterium]